MDMLLLLFLATIIPQVIICAGIIQAVELLKDILEELEGRREHGSEQ